MNACIHSVHFCTPDDSLVVRNKLSFIQILSQFVKPPSDTLLRYFNMFHLEPSPSSLQFIYSPFALRVGHVFLFVFQCPSWYEYLTIDYYRWADCRKQGLSLVTTTRKIRGYVHVNFRYLYCCTDTIKKEKNKRTTPFSSSYLC
jgi:hypothetical protein